MTDVAEGTCTIEWCSGTTKSRGYCSRHYQRFRRYGDPLAGRTPLGEPWAFFQAKVQLVTPQCTLWPYAKAAAGYGQVTLDGVHRYVHILACERWHGPKPAAGMEVCHGPCESKLCFNGAHLRWGTRASNMLDKTRDGVQVVGEAHHKTTITTADVIAIRARRAAGESIMGLAAAYDMSTAGISRIANRLSWTHVP